jgi:hypothetical protein
MKNILIILVLALFLIVGCVQQPLTPGEPKVEEPEKTCTEMWLCVTANSKGYRRADCAFEQVTDCPAGCENGECKKAEKTELEPKEAPKETEEECTIGWKCLDEKRRGYQLSTCSSGNVVECEYGCKDGKCLLEAPSAPSEESVEGAFILTQGKNKLNKIGRRYSDFSEGQIFEDEVGDYDVKVKLYAKVGDYEYLRTESPNPGVWMIEKGIEEATRADCMKEIRSMDSYHNLRTGQTLCIQTTETDIALVGGYWEGLPGEDTELSWKYYVPK